MIKLAEAHVKLEAENKKSKRYVNILAEKYVKLEKAYKASKVNEAKALKLNALLTIAPEGLSRKNKKALAEKFDACKSISEVTKLSKTILEAFKKVSKKIVPTAKKITESVTKVKAKGQKRIVKEGFEFAQSEEDKRAAWLSGADVEDKEAMYGNY